MGQKSSVQGWEVLELQTVKCERDGKGQGRKDGLSSLASKEGRQRSAHVVSK
jgi:hypothetical protein